MTASPSDPAVFWETLKPWLQGGIGSALVGGGVAIRWAWTAWRDRRKDRHTEHLTDEELALKERAQLLAEQEILRKGARDAAADAIAEADRQGLRFAAASARADRWEEIARAWHAEAHRQWHERENARQLAVSIYEAAAKARLPFVREMPKPQFSAGARMPPLEAILDLGRASA